MSRPRPDLANDPQAAQQYVAWLGGIPSVDRVLLQGSRSPLREKQPNENSDWDFVAVSDVPNLRLVRPRDSNHKLHADLITVTSDKAKLINKAVEVYPTDTHGVFA